MTSTVSPVGSDPSSNGTTPDEHARASILLAKGRIRRIAEEEHILVILLAGFGLIFLLIFPPALIVNDSWLNLMAGREVVENGLPSVDELTIYGLGSTWTDQQWVAQVFMYGVYSLGGFALLSIMACVFVVGAFTLAARRVAIARRRPAGDLAPLPPRPHLRGARLVDPRADAHAPALHRAPLAPRRAGAAPDEPRLDLAADARRLGRTCTGAPRSVRMLVMLLGAYELIRTRGRSWLRERRPARARPARSSRHPVRPGRRQRATTTCCSSIRRSQVR